MMISDEHSKGRAYLSSCEAEIMAASEAAKDAIYFKNYLSELALTPASGRQEG